MKIEYDNFLQGAIEKIIPILYACKKPVNDSYTVILCRSANHPLFLHYPLYQKWENTMICYCPDTRLTKEVDIANQKGFTLYES